MIKIYSMSTCQDCIQLQEQIKASNRYEVIDIGVHVKNLKEFLKLRDSNAVFDEARKNGTIGIPCFILEDGTITLTPEDAGLQSGSVVDGASCNIDGSGC